MMGLENESGLQLDYQATSKAHAHRRIQGDRLGNKDNVNGENSSWWTARRPPVLEMFGIPSLCRSLLQIVACPSQIN
jgi:hypothetical protein